MSKPQSEAILKDLEQIEKIKAKQEKKNKKDQEMQIALMLQVAENDEKAKERAELDAAKEARRLLEAQENEQARKRKAEQRLQEMEAGMAAMEKAAAARQREKDLKEEERQKNILEFHMREVEEREEARRQAVIRQAAVRAAEEAALAETIRGFEESNKLLEEKLQRFQRQKEERLEQSKLRAEQKQRELEAAQERVQAAVEQVREEARLKDIRMKERFDQLERERQADAAQRAHEKHEKERVMEQKRQSAEMLEANRIKSILIKQELENAMVEASKQRREHEMEEKSLAIQRKYSQVCANVEDMRDREAQRIQSLLEHATLKNNRSAEFLHERDDLLKMRGVLRHEELKKKQGWSLLSTQEAMQKQQKVAMARMKRELQQAAEEMSHEEKNVQARRPKTEIGSGHFDKRKHNDSHSMPSLKANPYFSLPFVPPSKPTRYQFKRQEFLEANLPW
eukprot:CAMPEP_0196582452 /NCGR_PEP_ID=MMETSP1081-20130531/38946_1 /TAXON_ID=36882 /ORGANISM="Pyramimonas amylifera, Strain CCMP720" /LENGTH=453 /DNA_ID=CAMNT_0041903011 /DNA_START=122 /DNA_END=1480 /DNA_ORIENTATION=-